MAACATVLMARIPAALNQTLKQGFMVHISFQIQHKKTAAFDCLFCMKKAPFD
jgi:hypothetical protein